MLDIREKYERKTMHSYNEWVIATGDEELLLILIQVLLYSKTHRNQAEQQQEIIKKRGRKI